jgi:phage shock protein E
MPTTPEDSMTRQAKPLSRSVPTAMAGAFMVPLLALGACSSGDAAVTDVSTPQAAALIADGGVTVLDVRTPAEYSAGHVPDAINIDVSAASFDAQVGALPKDATYVVYCRSGNRSTTASARMADLGFTTINNVKGSINDWSAAGITLVN